MPTSPEHRYPPLHQDTHDPSHNPRPSIHHRFQPCLRRLTPRKIFHLVIGVFFLLVLGVLASGIPPTYEGVRRYERSLPQHNLTAAVEQGTRYLRVPDRVTGHGLNNVLQEALLLSYLAFRLDRAFVFEDYIWSYSPSPYVIYDFALRPSRLPLNAFISGPSAGGPMSGPRAVSAAFWDDVCPPSERRVVSSAGQPTYAEGSVILDWWLQKIGDLSDRCVEIDSRKQPVFDYILFGSPHILSLWEGYSASPILTQFAWSPIVYAAVSNNIAAIAPAPVSSASTTNPATAGTATGNPTATIPSTIPGLVAIHLRRGDFTRHCHRAVGWDAAYMGFSRFPQFPEADRFDPPPRGVDARAKTSDERTREREGYYLRHCIPTIPQIVQKLRAVRREHPGLGKVYALTNGWGVWMDQLGAALREDGWGEENLGSTLGLVLDREQRHVAMAVDMAIAERAEVFVGNGFSSMTSNIMMLRMARGVDPLTNRLF